jgi:hypothetical protein
MKTVILAALAAVVLASSAHADFTLLSFKKKTTTTNSSCISCTTRCNQCGASESCRDACKGGGNPLVQQSSRCGEWYVTDGCGKR